MLFIKEWNAFQTVHCKIAQFYAVVVIEDIRGNFSKKILSLHTEIVIVIRFSFIYFKDSKKLDEIFEF